MPHEGEIQTILREGRDMTVATLLPDGAPHATVVSYANDGLTLYFGCAPTSQKAANLARDDRVAVTVALPYRDWSEIRGLAIRGHARRLPVDEQESVRLLFAEKFSEIVQYVETDPDALALFEIRASSVSVLDYRHGFGHVDHVPISS